MRHVYFVCNDNLYYLHYVRVILTRMQKLNILVFFPVLYIPGVLVKVPVHLLPLSLNKPRSCTLNTLGEANIMELLLSLQETKVKGQDKILP